MIIHISMLCLAGSSAQIETAAAPGPTAFRLTWRELNEQRLSALAPKKDFWQRVACTPALLGAPEPTPAWAGGQGRPASTTPIVVGPAGEF